MKFEIVTRYLARLFIREPRTAPTLMRLAADLADRGGLAGWEPTSVNDVDMATSQVSQGYMLVSPDQVWTAKITGESFDVSVTQGFNLQTRTHVEVPTFGEFLKRVGELFAVAGQLNSTKPHRIAVVQGGVLPPPSERAASLDAVRAKLVNLPPLNGAPFEWNWRGAWKVSRSFGGVTEPTNTVMTVRQSTVRFPEALGDRLIVDLDINTDSVNATPRFSGEEVAAFVIAAEGWHAALAKDLSDYAGIDQ